MFILISIKNMLLLIYRRYVLAAVPALDCEKMIIEKDKVTELKMLFEEMISEISETCIS